VILAIGSSAAGIATAIEAGIASVGVLFGMLAGVLPLLRHTRKNSIELGQIHRLVNGNLTAAKQHELDASRRELVTLKEVQRLHTDAGHAEDQDARAEIARTTLGIAKLETEITERRALDVQIKQEHEGER